VLDSESYSKHSSGTASPSLGSISVDHLPVCPIESPSAASEALCVLYAGSFGLCINLSRACIVSPSTSLSLCYVFFILAWKSLVELPLTTTDH